MNVGLRPRRGRGWPNERRIAAPTMSCLLMSTSSGAARPTLLKSICAACCALTAEPSNATAATASAHPVVIHASPENARREQDGAIVSSNRHLRHAQRRVTASPGVLLRFEPVTGHLMCRPSECSIGENSTPSRVDKTPTRCIGYSGVPSAIPRCRRAVPLAASRRSRGGPCCVARGHRRCSTRSRIRIRAREGKRHREPQRFLRAAHVRRRLSALRRLAARRDANDGEARDARTRSRALRRLHALGSRQKLAPGLARWRGETRRYSISSSLRSSSAPKNATGCDGVAMPSAPSRSSTRCSARANASRSDT